MTSRRVEGMTDTTSANALHDSVLVVWSVGGAPGAECRWDEWVDSNADFWNDGEPGRTTGDEITAALLKHGEYVVGGGAHPGWFIALVGGRS